MVMRKGENWRAEDLRKYVRENYPPGTRVISRKPSNRGAALIHPSGEVIEKGRSNFDLVRRLTDPNSKRKAEKRQLCLIELPPVINIKNHSENTAIMALCYLTELAEITGENNPRIICDEEGMPERIKLGVLEFTQKGCRP